MIRADLHSHTNISHGTAPVAEMYAASKGHDLDYFGFSEHSPLPDGYSCQLYTGDLAGEFPSWAASVLALEGKPKALLGLELDWLPGRFSYMRALIASQPFDYVLGSLHYLDGYSVGRALNWTDDVSLEERFGRFDAYFYEMAGMAKSGLVQIASHPDFIKLRAWKDFQTWLELPQSRNSIAHAMQSLAANGVVMEVNSAGLRQDFHEPYPCPAIMRLAREHNVKICFGSDAHEPLHVAFGLDALARYAASFGFEEYVIFINKEPVSFKF